MMAFEQAEVLTQSRGRNSQSLAQNTDLLFSVLEFKADHDAIRMGKSREEGRHLLSYNFTSRHQANFVAWHRDPSHFTLSECRILETTLQEGLTLRTETLPVRALLPLLLAFWILTIPGWTQPPPTQIMYLSPDEELKLAVAIKRQQYPWPALRVGIGKSGPRWFGHIRFWVAPGAGRAHVLRQCRQATLLAFRMFQPLHHLDIDACPMDDTPQEKAKPWFAASMERDKVLKTSLELPPQSWFEVQGPVTLREHLHAEGNPALSLAQALMLQWNKPLPRK